MWPSPNVTREQRPWTRKVEDEINALRRMLERGSRGQASSEKPLARAYEVRRLNEAISALAVPDGASETAAGFTLSTEWKEIVRVELTVPEGKKTAVVTAVADGMVLTASKVEARIRIRSTDSTAFVAGQSSGFALTSASFGRKVVNIDVGPDPEARLPLVIGLWVKAGTEVLSDPDNAISITATAVFFNE